MALYKPEERMIYSSTECSVNFCRHKQKLICGWLNGGGGNKHKNQILGILVDWRVMASSSCDAAIKKNGFTKVNVLIFEIWPLHLSWLIYTPVVVYNWERAFVRKGTSWLVKVCFKESLYLQLTKMLRGGVTVSYKCILRREMRK